MNLHEDMEESDRVAIKDGRMEEIYRNEWKF